MEHLTNLLDQQQIEEEDDFAKRHAALRDAESEADATCAIEAEERARAHAQEKGPRTVAHPTIDPVHQVTQSLSGTSILQEQQPTDQATAFQTGTIEVVQQSDELAVFNGC